jgi:Tfp pilus assembly protein PilO
MAKKTFWDNVAGFQISEWILKNLGFTAFLGVLAIVYIANAHQAEGNVRQIQELQREVRELRWRYMSLQSENMFNSLRSEVVDKVRDDGLQLHRGAPKKILVSQDSEY